MKPVFHCHDSNLNPRWQSYTLFTQKHQVSPAVLEWLLHSGSMSNRLRHQCQKVQIKVLNQQWSLSQRHEMQKLHLTKRICIFIREVQIFCDDALWMFARTVIPPLTYERYQIQFKELADGFLGDVLFTHPQLRRSEFELASLDPHCRDYAFAVSGDDNPAYLLARRSVFYINHYSLLLTEVFSPEMLLKIIK
jgi:chorismate--pyruvate lyase